MEKKMETTIMKNQMENANEMDIVAIWAHTGEWKTTWELLWRDYVGTTWIHSFIPCAPREILEVPGRLGFKGLGSVEVASSL